MTNATIDVEELPIQLDLAPIKVGADYAFTIEIQDDNEEARDTTGWDMEITARANGTNGPEVFNLTVGAGITHTPTVGRFAIKISSAITEAITVAKLAWDCKITDNNGDITYPFEGTWEVRQSVTR